MYAMYTHSYTFCVTAPTFQTLHSLCNLSVNANQTRKVRTCLRSCVWFTLCVVGEFADLMLKAAYSFASALPGVRGTAPFTAYIFAPRYTPASESRSSTHPTFYHILGTALPSCEVTSRLLMKHSLGLTWRFHAVAMRQRGDDAL